MILDTQHQKDFLLRALAGMDLKGREAEQFIKVAMAVQNAHIGKAPEPVPATEPEGKTDGP